MSGQAFHRQFYLIAQPLVTVAAEPDLPKDNTPACCCDGSLKALADPDNSGDPLRNDVAGFLYWFSPAVIDCVLELWKFEGGDFIFKETLDAGSSLGDGNNYEYGYKANSDGELFVGFQLKWVEVLDAYGEGGYKIKRTITDAFGATYEIFSEDYCLKTYTPERANRTVRLEYFLNSIQGDVNDVTKKKNLVGFEWYNSYRFDGYFNFAVPEITEEYNQYYTGARKFMKSERMDEYKLSLWMVPKSVQKILRSDFLQADERFITDYNNNTPETIVKLQVNPKNWKPTFDELQLTTCDIEAAFNPAFNQNKKLRE